MTISNTFAKDYCKVCKFFYDPIEHLFYICYAILKLNQFCVSLSVNVCLCMCLSFSLLFFFRRSFM